MPKPIKYRFTYKMNWGKKTFKITDTHTGQTMSLREWDLIELSKLVPRFLMEFIKRKGQIKDINGKIYTKEQIIKSLKENEQKTNVGREEEFETDPDSY
ncbi:MAG: hypothetical protein ACOC5T_03505 [Elusimicrobiota bacterium]